MYVRISACQVSLLLMHTAYLSLSPAQCTNSFVEPIRFVVCASLKTHVMPDTSPQFFLNNTLLILFSLSNAKAKQQRMEAQQLGVLALDAWPAPHLHRSESLACGHGNIKKLTHENKVMSQNCWQNLARTLRGRSATVPNSWLIPGRNPNLESLTLET